MQVSKILVALTVAGGFVSASFAQGAAAPTSPVAPAAKVTAPAPATAEKKVDAPKAAEPVKAEKKVEAPKAADPVKAEVKADAKGDVAKPAKTTDTLKAKKAEQHAAKAESSIPPAVVAVAAAPASK